MLGGWGPDFVPSSFNPSAEGTHLPAPGAPQALESHGFQALANLLGARRAADSRLTLWVGTVEVKLMGAMHNMAQAALRMLQPHPHLGSQQRGVPRWKLQGHGTWCQKEATHVP